MAALRSKEQFHPYLATPHSEKHFQPDLATLEELIQPDLAKPEERILATPEELIQPDFAPEELIQPDFAPEELIQPDLATPEERILGTSLLEEQFQPYFLMRHLEDMLPFIKPADVKMLARLGVEKKLVSDSEKEIIEEAMHGSVTPQQKFRYLMWNMYCSSWGGRHSPVPSRISKIIHRCSRVRSSSNRPSPKPLKMNSRVEVVLGLLATLPCGKSLARDYQSKSAPSKITKISSEINSIYDWLVKRFSDPKFISENQPVSNSKNVRIKLNERKDIFMFFLDGCAGPIKANTSYNWYKNGADFGKKIPIECIKVADITVEGKYTMTRNSILMASITICLKTFMDNFRQDLTNKYLETVTNVDKDEWPKVKQNTYINLAVIKSDKSDNLNSYVCQTIRGDADDVHGEKGETDYKSAFESIQHGERVIVQGRPGSGKTTLVHKISQDWADHSIEWGHVKALFLIHLRGFRSRSSVNLKDFLLCYFTSEKTVKSIGDYIILKDGLGICFILDGLDEYQSDDETAFVFKLIEKKVLSKAIVIVASRPAAVAKYRSTGKNVEVLGFFKKQISDYIDSYEFRSLCSGSMLKEYLTNRPNIHHMCYLPIQVAMICFLYDHFEEEGNTFPDTETEVYEQFARHMLLRTIYRQRSKENFYLKSIFSLPEVEERLLSSICTLAFEKTLSSLQVLEQADVDIFCEQINTNSCLGLLTVDRKATICGFQNMYTFCHLTFQEFLAACHVYLASDVNQSELIKVCHHKEHMTVVLKFFCGLEDFQSVNGAKFENVINSPHLNTLAKVQCAYESKQPITCQHVVKNNTLNITENFLTTRDWSSISFVIANASHNVVKCLQLNHSVMTEEGANALTKSIETIQKLVILGNFNHLPLFFIYCLHQVNVIQLYDCNVPKLVIKFDLKPINYFLSLSSNIIVRETTSQDFISFLYHIIEKSLTSINAFLATELKSQLHNICKSSMCIKLSGMIKKDSKQNIMIVTSGTQQIQEDVYFILCIRKQTKNFSALFSHYTLEYMDIIPFGNCLIVIILLSATKTTYFRLFVLPKGYVNKLSLKCMDKIVESLELGVSYHSLNRRLCICKSQNEDLELQQLFDHALEQLEIKCDGTKDCSYFTKYLDLCTKLKTFSFQASETMFLPAMRNIVKSLSLKKIEVLQLINCDLEDVMDISLVPALRAWKTLRELCLKNCSITGKSVTSLVQAITACAQLTALDLSDNDIGDEGCQALAVSMVHKYSQICSFPHLRNLNLSNCNIKDAGIFFLANTLQNYSSLKFLGMTKTKFQNVSLEKLFLAFQKSKSLTEMDLSYSTLEGFSAFSSPMLKSLQILKLCACKPQYFSLAPLVKNNLLLSSLHVLDLSGNNWPVSDLIQIFDLTNKLQELCLSGLSLSQNVSRYLTEGLMKPHNLNILRFNYFKMYIIDVSFIEFITNESIAVLELCHLECDYYSYEQICHRIKDAKCLHSLDLSHNVAINNVSQKLSISIEQCRNLKTLRLCDCGIRNNEAEQLAAAIIACESIRSIDMSQNDFDDVCVESLSSKFAHCDHLITFQVKA